MISPQIIFASSLSSWTTVSADCPPSNFLPAGFSGGILCDTMVTLEILGLTLLTSTCALFAIIIPLTFGFLTFMAPLSQLTTTGVATLIIASPPSAGAVTVSPSANVMPVTLETEAQPNFSATPGPVEPEPVSAEDLPQYTTSYPS